MKKKLLSVAVLVFVFSVQALAASPDEVRGQYVGKQLMLRNFYCGRELKFDVQGKLLSGGRSGAWTLCRDIRIEHIKVKGGRFEIGGQRIYLFYDPQQKRFRDVMEIADKKKAGFKKLVNSQKVSLQVDIPQNSDEKSIQNTMDMLFYSSEEQFTEAVPVFWKVYFKNAHRQEAQSRPVVDLGRASQPTDPAGSDGRISLPDGKVDHVGNGVSAPVPVYSPDPDYTEEARQSFYQGTAVMTVIVGADGRVHRAIVSRCLGMGLDDKAVEKILTWNFKPAMRNGEAVAVEVSVEVRFNLY